MKGRLRLRNPCFCLAELTDYQVSAGKRLCGSPCAAVNWDHRAYWADLLR